LPWACFSGDSHAHGKHGHGTRTFFNFQRAAIEAQPIVRDALCQAKGQLPKNSGFSMLEP